uniref:Transcriptional regulatory protein ZraR n=1 Tax=wastewater metagenome TaxID=527639 RepID=A0A0A8KXR2_9ZZZZ
MRYNILIVDDNKDMQFNLTSILEDEHYSVECAGDGREAIDKVKEFEPDIVLLDIRLPEIDGLKVLEEIKYFKKEIQVIMLTAFGDIKSAVKSMRLGAFDYVTKPFDTEELLLIISKALESLNLNKEVISLRERLTQKNVLDKVIGESESFKKVLEEIKIVAPTNMTVVIQGDSGTGKEGIAMLINEMSSRRDKPLVAIDCGAIPDSLVESELFGHEKGAFTGADKTKMGKFEEANFGTLYFDELTNLSMANQMKLFRVLQERKFQRVGGNKTIEVDVRIIVASSKKLLDCVSEGTFRKELYYRLIEFQINLPTLKERKDDIPLLAESFLRQSAADFNRTVSGFSDEAMNILMNYDWPGNIRELKNTIRRSVLTARNSIIHSNEIHIESISGVESKKIDFLNSSEEEQKEILISTLQKNHGNKIKTAEILGINRKTLYRKLLYFDIK